MRPWLALGLAVLVATLVVGLELPSTARGAGDEARVLLGLPTTLDPAAAGDHGSSSVIAQLHESLTAIDPALTVKPALAESWDIEDGGRRVVFRLRDGLTFSDGSPLRAEDVVRSWLRVIDPTAPSPLATLFLDVEGARDYLGGTIAADGVGIRANDRDVEVDLIRPAADFPAVVAGPTFAVVPKDLRASPGPPAADSFVGSGAYVVAGVTETELTLRANERYWAGRPAIGTIHLVHDLGGRSTVAAYEAGDLDYTAISGFDASWIRYDATLGPDLRAETSPSVSYLAFDTTRPPFDDVKVRQAVGAAVDWRRIVELAGGADAVPASGLVPPGIPGRSERDFLPAHDPDAARALLAEAGYPDGEGFPPFAIASTGGGYLGAIAAELRRELAIDVSVEFLDFDVLTERLDGDPPAMWTLAWVADYPGANDFLGVLLGTGEPNNSGGWSSPEFDAALADALHVESADDAVAAFERAQEIVQRDVPLVPLDYASGWSLAREGLLGAQPGGLGIPRLAGFAWAGQ